MATSGKREAIPAGLKEFFDCKYCGKTTEYMENPVVLPCLHSICLECLETLVRMSRREKEAECPSCACLSEIPPGGLGAFPKDSFSRVAKKTLTEPGFNFVPGGPNPTCGIHPQKRVTDYCHRCKVQVCKACVCRQPQTACEWDGRAGHCCQQNESWTDFNACR